MTIKYEGPTLSISKELHETKYRLEGEPFFDAVHRFSSTLSDNDKHRHALNDIVGNMRFLPAGRVQAAIGSPRRITPWNCLGGTVKVLTKEYGLREIRELYSLGESTVLDGNREWIKVKFNYLGKQKLYSIKLTNGQETEYINATAGHNWVTATGELIPTDKLQKNDRIDFLSVNKRISEGGYVDYRKGIVHGLIYGDGTKTNDNGFTLRVCADHEDLKWYLERYPFSYPPTYMGDPIYYFYGKNAWANFKEFPKVDNVDYLLGFIRGWLAADGCVSTQSEVTICGDDEEREWLSKYGPIAGFYIKGYSYLTEFTNYGERNKKSQNIRISDRSLVKDDFIINRKQSRFKQKRNAAWRVASVSLHKPYELVDLVFDVYCPEVPTTHSFSIGFGVHSGNCFVSGTIADDFDDIMEKAKEAGHTMRLGGGIGYDFSTLRPRGSIIKSLGSQSSGPVSFMAIYDTICGTISSAGHRRGAQMGVLRVDHPDILEFVHSKRNSNSLTRFNISVGITDTFMKAVKNDTEYSLKFKGKTYNKLKARTVWDAIMRSTWDWAEPGVLFIDRINDWNNLYYCENIAATNPCGEQPLPPYGACLLGSFNLVKYTGPKRLFRDDLLQEDVRHIVRAMDNIIDIGIYPLPQQEEEGKSKRRMGLGVTGLANTLEYLGKPYGSESFLEFMEEILSIIQIEAYNTSIELAKEKGPFPLFDKERYLKGKFIQTLPSIIKEGITENGIRNSHLLSIAPTGTISLVADNVSSGIEPIFSYEYNRTIQEYDGPKIETIQDYGYRVWGIKGRTANEVTAQEHIAVLTTAQKYVDSSVSKTCNVGVDVTWEEFKNIYMTAYDNGAKGCTTFRAAGKREGILKETEKEYISDDDTVEICMIDPNTGQPTCS